MGRIIPEYFPNIFGPTEDQPLDLDATKEAFEKLTSQINQFILKSGQDNRSKTAEEVAYGFIKVANEAMCRPIRNMTEAKGFSAMDHVLASFGGAGPQHACAIAKTLGMKKVYLHRFSGILSAYGLGLADLVFEKQEPSSLEYSKEIIHSVISDRIEQLTVQVKGELFKRGFNDDNIEILTYLNLRYKGTDTSLMILRGEDEESYISSFQEQYQREFGFTIHGRPIQIDDIRVRGIGKSKASQNNNKAKQVDESHIIRSPVVISIKKVYFEDKGYVDTPVYDLKELDNGSVVIGPAIILNQTSTFVIEFDCTANITSNGDVEIVIGSSEKKSIGIARDEIQLSVFAHRFMSIAEQMGRTLQRTSISTNIKERLDFSCALFGPDGGLVANAPHLPVHLGSMQEAVKWQINFLKDDWKEGEVIMTNHPAAGGSHLPDITVITPVFSEGKAVFYVASRGHHAEIGGISPGSMPPFSHLLVEEGACIKSFKLVEHGEFQEEKISDLLCNFPNSIEDGDGYQKNLISGTRNLKDNLSDLKAQVAANNKGITLVQELIKEYGLDVVHAYMSHVQQQAEESVRDMLQTISRNRNLQEVDKIVAKDYMDDGSLIQLALTIDRKERTAIFDFTGTSCETFSNFNAPKSITYSAIIYSLRCLVKDDIPLNQGCLKPITVILPQGSILCPSDEAAVVGGNVLTSQRVTDTILQAFGACACSQGCMNNFTFGNNRMGYYETIAGGSGAGPTWHGESGVHSHMTNTRITDPEILEHRYPVLLREFSIRPNSGGDGLFKGGDGVIREIEFLEKMTVGILSERRSFAPPGLFGGSSAVRGLNLYKKFIPSTGERRIINLGGKNTLIVNRYDLITIHSPGGGGFGSPVSQSS